MKRRKRWGALVLAGLMALTAAFPVMAAEKVKPTAEDDNTVTVKNVESGMKVTAYQIVKGKYNEAGFIGYEAAEWVKIADLEHPTAEEIQAVLTVKEGEDASVLESLIKKELGEETQGEGETKTTLYKGELNAGTWLVLVTAGEGADGEVPPVKVYNPMLVSVKYKIDGSDNTTEGGTVDAADKWMENGQVVYAKSSEPKPEKTILEGENGQDETKGTGREVGDTVVYQIKMQMPSYSQAVYEEAVFTVKDTLSEGLDFDEAVPVKVTVGGVEVPAGTDTYELTTPKDGSKELVIAFASGYVLENGTREVVITYGAKINEQAKVQGLNFDGNANDVTLTYTNGPGSTEDAKTKAYVYTFGIGASLSGKTDIVGNKVTHEIVKVGEDFVSKDTYEEWVEEGKPGALAGAEFTLTKVKDRDGNAVTDAVPMTAETGEGGILTFTGLSEGEYTLVETKAPEGYSLDSTEHVVKIEAEYQETTGLLTKLKITIDGTVVNEYEAAYEISQTGETKITEIVDAGDPDVADTLFVKNTKLSQLPSTGGMGTYLFTILGVAVMATAAGLFLVRRRKQP